jgi:hypothetical protein
MSDEYTLSLEQFAIDWLRDSSWHYRQSLVGCEASPPGAAYRSRNESC